MIDVTVCIPSIPRRAGLRRRAVTSVKRQTVQPKEIVIHVDRDGVGAARARNITWKQATTEWIAFLDDDDEFLPDHLEKLTEAAAHVNQNTAVLYPWFTIPEPQAKDPLSLHGLPVFGQSFDASELRHHNYVPITVLIRRSALIKVGGFPVPNTDEWPHKDCEDWGCWLRLLDAGYTFAHVPYKTWLWHHHGANTSGQSWRTR